MILFIPAFFLLTSLVFHNVEAFGPALLFLSITPHLGLFPILRYFHGTLPTVGLKPALVKRNEVVT